MKFKREGVICLETPQRKRALSRLEGRTSWIFSTCSRSLSSYDGDFRDPLLWPQERAVSLQVARGRSGFLSSWCRGLRPHVGSSLGNCGFLSSANMYLGLLPESPQDSQSSSRVGTCTSFFLLNCSSSVKIPVVFKQGCVAFD